MTILYISGPSFSLAFVFSINSLILCGFPLTSFGLAKASLSAFLWFYILGCAVVQNIKCNLLIIIHIFSAQFAINVFSLHELKT